MQLPLQITFRGIDPSDYVERRIRAKVTELERFHDRITSCRVTVEAAHHHHHKGNLYSVRVDIRLPDKEIVAGHERHNDHAHEDVYVAIRDSFNAAVRQLEDHARKRRGEVKRHETPVHGKVSKLFRDDGYGFVETVDGMDVYFHENSVAGVPFPGLVVGDDVRLVLAEGEGEKGPQASTVVPLGKQHAVEESLSRP
jgi:ribosomal subunit interface protein